MAAQQTGLFEMARPIGVFGPTERFLSGSTLCQATQLEVFSTAELSSERTGTPSPVLHSRTVVGLGQLSLNVDHAGHPELYLD